MSERKGSFGIAPIPDILFFFNHNSSIQFDLPFAL